MAGSTGVPHAREHTYRLVRALVQEFAARVIAAVEADVEARVRSTVVGGPRMSLSTGAAVRKAKELIESRYAENLPLDVLARETGRSKFFLARKFRRQYGQPVHQYLKRVRVERALDLLRQGMRPIAVATQVGFADQAHMTRVFRAQLGCTPGQVHRQR
jgi:AraC-like DNA-binding protein